MMKETMTVHAALCELKMLPKRIEKTIEELNPIAVKENQAVKVNGMKADEFEKQAKAAETKVLDLIRRQNAIKGAINTYNATATIIMDGTEYTIASAVWLMQYGMVNKKRLLEHYERAYSKASKTLKSKNGEELAKAAERAAELSVGNRDSVNGEEFLETIKKYKERHQMEFVDPLKLLKRIETLRDEIESFESQVDAKIQTKNAMTEISIEY